MDMTLVQLDLHSDVKTTPYVDRRLAELNVDKQSGTYSLVGRVLDSKTVAQHVAVKFHLTAILRKGEPHLFVDDKITLTPTSFTHIKGAQEPGEIEVYRLKNSMLMEGICLMPGEELAFRHNSRYFLCMDSTEVQVSSELLHAVRENSERKVPFSFVVAEAKGWRVYNVLAYSKDDAVGRIVPKAPHFITDTALVPGEYHTEELLHCGSCWTSFGGPSNFLTNMRSIYERRAKIEDLESDELLRAWQAMNKTSPSKPQAVSNLP